MHAKGTKQVRESAAVSNCTKISCVRKVGEPRIRKLIAYKIFWIYSTDENSPSSMHKSLCVRACNNEEKESAGEMASMTSDTSSKQ